MSKIIKVSCCAEGPFHGECEAWKKIPKKQQVILSISNSIPHDFMLKDCHLEDLTIMPESLTAENGAKGLLIGEFHETVIMQCEGCEGEGEIYCEGIGETCEYCTGSGDYALKVLVGWGTIKDIYAKCAEYFQNKLDNKDN